VGIASSQMDISAPNTPQAVAFPSPLRLLAPRQGAPQLCSSVLHPSTCIPAAHQHGDRAK